MRYNSSISPNFVSANVTFFMNHQGKTSSSPSITQSRVFASFWGHYISHIADRKSDDETSPCSSIARYRWRLGRKWTRRRRFSLNTTCIIIIMASQTFRVCVVIKTENIFFFFHIIIIIIISFRGPLFFFRLVGPKCFLCSGSDPFSFVL